MFSMYKHPVNPSDPNEAFIHLVLFAQANVYEVHKACDGIVQVTKAMTPGRLAALLYTVRVLTVMNSKHHFNRSMWQH
jgi:hypothetical protein